MRLRSITATPFRTPLKICFRHASAQRAAAESLIVTARAQNGRAGYGEGCPRPYVTGETLEGAMAFVRQIGPALAADIHDLADLRAWVASASDLIDANPAAFCALEMAVVDVLAQQNGCSAEALLGLPELDGVFRYTAVIDDADAERFRGLSERYYSTGFRDFKIKLSGDLDLDRAKLAYLRRFGGGDEGLRIRVDANNLWRRADECIDFLCALGQPLFAVEEPLLARDFDGMLEVTRAIGVRIVLDESLLYICDLTRLEPTAQHWLLNCRISKLGGVMRSLALVTEARRVGLQLIVGAHVGETSLLTRAALPIARQAGPALVAQEGAFGTHLLTRDPCTPIVMFAGDGVLRVPGAVLASHSGWGVDVDLDHSDAALAI